MATWHEILGWKAEQIAEVRQLAYSYARQGVYEVCRDLLHMVQVLAPDEPYEAQLLGAVYLEEGDLKQATHWLQEALRLDPSHLPTRLNWCKVQLQTGALVDGLLAAERLRRESDPVIAADAEALMMAYQRAA
jgi:Tfp pilus assembly protein PilF